MLKTSPLKLVVIYLIFGIGWILTLKGQTTLLAAITGLDENSLGPYKAMLFVCVSAVIFYYIIKAQSSALRNSEKQYKNLFYANPTPLWIYDQHSLKFLEVNDAASTFYGYTSEDFKKMTILDIRDKNDHDRVLKAVKEMPAGGKESGKWEHLKKNGDRIIVMINSHQIIFQEKEAVMVMAQDITYQIAQEEQLKLMYSTERELKEELEMNIVLIERSLEEKQRMAEVIDRIYNMVMIIDAYGKITWVNQAFIHTTGYSFEEAVGNSPEFLHGPNTDLEIYQKIINAVKDHEFSVFEIINYTKTGEEYWVELSMSAIYNENHEIIRVISILNIITERKLNEEKIKLQNTILKNISWTNSHAIRKSVTSILGLLNLSKDATGLEELKEIHRMIADCSKELDDTTKDMGKVMSSLLQEHK
ncbi:PAS domain S-box protein [Pedobacter sp.]|uniref:PAS domain S-box protein n=1 Tax=Pedobacter sp. TaxID=1411316 RepID=UPI003D7FD725